MICAGGIAPVAVAQETPFVINGYVSYANGEPVLNPTVTITNQNTNEIFTAETHANSSYYRMQTDSKHVHAGDRITINATDGTYAVGAIYSITEADIENGGFRQNLPSMPDLVITSANVTCLENKTFNITYTVANTGNENGGASQTTIYIDGSPVLDKDDPVAVLAPGEVYTNTVGPFNFPQRSPWILVCADNDDTVDEFNEDNNCMETRLECPLPNLQITEQYLGHSVVEWVDSAKGEYYIHYKVYSLLLSGGKSNTSINITTVASDGSILHSDILKQPVFLGYGGIYKKTGTLTCLCNHNVTVEICADADTEILESNESDNCYKTSFVCPASESPPDLEPDLAITNHSVAWINRTDRAFNVTYTVKNIGNGNANSSTTNLSVVNYDDPVPALSPDESYTNTVGPFDATFDESNHYYVAIIICANYYKTVTESDEANNCATDGIGTPYLNISIKSVDWVELNKTYNISYEVLNSGGAASTNVTRAYVYIDGNTNASATEKVGIMPKPPIDNPTSVTGLFGPFAMTGTSDTINVCVEWEDGKNCVEEVFGYQATSEFDTGTGTYPGISGTHNGTLIPDEDIEVNRLYTYSCAGTGGHTEYVRIWNESENVDGKGNWSGYPGDYHNVTISPALTLLKDHTYNYTITTGSYPQIVHVKSKPVTGGNITCTKFTDANGKRYTNWIPAIRLFYDGG
jgi:hypothetical protein